jgi:SpoVK/Ycf46/Vps4 family AAA+-type ATPase
MSKGTTMETLPISADVDLPLDGNALIVGPTGAGKTALVDRLSRAALAAGMDVVHVDEARRGDRIDARVRRAQTLADARVLLRWLLGEVARRSGGDVGPRAPIVAFVDGLAHLSAPDALPVVTEDPASARLRRRVARDNRVRQGIVADLLRILRGGPKAGVFVVAAAQRALDLDPAIRSRFDAHVILGYVPAGELRVLLGEEDATRAFAVDISQPGDGVLCACGLCRPLRSRPSAAA